MSGWKWPPHSLPLRDGGHKFVNGFHRFLIGEPRRGREGGKKEKNIYNEQE